MGTIKSFPLGKKDVPTVFSIPQKLYGREQEIIELLAAFDEASHANAELVLISGYAGVGKTSLVQEAHKSIEKNGYFSEGRFDQMRPVPYVGWIQVVQGLIRKANSY